MLLLLNYEVRICSSPEVPMEDAALEAVSNDAGGKFAELIEVLRKDSRISVTVTEV